jgi:ADP-L-glycero-D-manno-heptose 6-epimerase
MNKALITGALGFIGSNLHIELKKQFKEVVGIEESIFLVDDWKNHLIEILEDSKPSVVFHVGACSNTLETDVNYMMTRNYEFTKLITDWCIKNNKPIIYSSSAANYGNDSYPTNLYGWSKYAAEDYVIKSGGVALRYFNVYGPGEEHKDKMASVAYQSYLKNKRGLEVKLFPLTPRRDFVYVKDVVNANIFALKNYFKLKKNYYDVGYGESRTFEDMLNILEIEYTYHDVLLIPKSYQFYTCSDKSKWLPNWEPKFSLELGLQEYKKYLEDKFL